MPYLGPLGPPSLEGQTMEVAEKKRLEKTTVPAELTLNLTYLARNYGLEEPYDFELASSILGDYLIMRGRRKR